MRTVERFKTIEVQAPWWDLEEKAWIRKLSHGDWEDIQAQSRKWKTKLEKGEETREMESAAKDVGTMTLLRGIAKWTDQQGEECPVEVELIKELEPQDADFLLEAINHFNPPLEEKDRESFRNEFKKLHPIGEAVATNHQNE